MSSVVTTARERVLAAFRGEETAYPPFTWGFGPPSGARPRLIEAFAREGIDWDSLRLASEDVAWLHAPYAGPPLLQGEAEYMTIWGIGTRTVDYGQGTYTDEIAHSPLAGVTDVAALEDYSWPSADDFDYSALPALRRELDPEGVRAVRLSGGNPLEIYCWMTGLEEALVNLLTEPELVTAALTRITGFFKDRLSREIAAVDAPVDIVQIGDDLGTQHGPMISLDAYREIVQPFHRELCAHIRKLAPNAVIAYHTDGSVRTMLPALIEAGVQMLEAVQVECVGMDPEGLAEDFGSRLFFQGAISVQQVLPKLPPAEVKVACRRLIDTLGRGGGYLAAPSHAVQAGTPPENILAMLEEVLGPERFLELPRKTP